VKNRPASNVATASIKNIGAYVAIIRVAS